MPGDLVVAVLISPPRRRLTIGGPLGPKAYVVSRTERNGDREFIWRPFRGS